MLMIHVAIFQRHQRMDFTFHTAYVILKRVHITAIFWTGISCWLKQATMTRLRCWNRYTNYWARWSFRSTMDLFPFTYNFTFLHHLQDVYWTGLWVTRRVSYKKQELLTLQKNLIHPLPFRRTWFTLFFVESVFIIVLVTCVVYLLFNCFVCLRPVCLDCLFLIATFIIFIILNFCPQVEADAITSSTNSNVIAI